jgi:O-antigen ligase
MLFRHAFQEFLSAPVFGVGLGQFGRADLAIAYQSNFGSYPHNIVLEILSSTGIVGMILFVMVLRPGRWMLHITTPYSILFLLSGLFAMTSGDVVANSGVIIFGVLARLAYYSRRANVSEQPGRALEKSDEGQEDPVHIHGPVPDRHKRKSSQD